MVQAKLSFKFFVTGGGLNNDWIKSLEFKLMKLDDKQLYNMRVWVYIL